MDPMDDRELNQLLREWKVPGAPAHLTPPTARKHWWEWLLTGSIRIPVPVGVAVAVLVAFWLYSTAPSRQPVAGTEPASRQPVVSLADFQPVDEVEIRVVGDFK